MSDVTKDEGVILALWERFHDQTLPRLKDIKAHLDTGASLSDSELEYLREVESRLPQITPIIDKRPALREIFIGATALIKEITDKAVANEPPHKK